MKPWEAGKNQKQRALGGAPFPTAGDVTALGSFLLAGYSQALKLWNPDVTHLKCAIINYKISHLFSSKRRKDVAQPTLIFFPTFRCFSRPGQR